MMYKTYTKVLTVVRNGKTYNHEVIFNAPKWDVDRKLKQAQAYFEMRTDMLLEKPN
jgi:hypothetical protein